MLAFFYFVLVYLIDFKLISYMIWKEGMLEIMNWKQGERKVHGLI